MNEVGFTRHLCCEDLGNLHVDKCDTEHHPPTDFQKM